MIPEPKEKRIGKQIYYLEEQRKNREKSVNFDERILN